MNKIIPSCPASQSQHEAAVVEVWHFSGSASEIAKLFLGDVDAIKAAWKDGLYTKVAECQTHELETAWRWTNNIDSSWALEPDPRVTVTAELKRGTDGRAMGLRSSSMGDVFVRGEEKFYAAMVGFEVLNLRPRTMFVAPL